MRWKVIKAVTALEQKYKVVGVALDLLKAFDSLDHGILFERLNELGIYCGLALKWITLNLTNRR